MPKIDIINLLITHPTQKKILCVKRSVGDATFGSMWALPGGAIEKNESINSAAKRELYEETGSTLKGLSKECLLYSPLNINGDIFKIGIYKAEVKTIKFSPKDKDIEKVEWISPMTLINSLKNNNYPEEEIQKLINLLKDVLDLRNLAATNK